MQDKFRELREEAEAGIKSSARYTVAEAVRDWLARGLINQDAKTVSKYRTLAEVHVIPCIGAVRLRELTADDVDDWLADRKK